VGLTSLRPGRGVRVTVPVRVADVGGWTDTWFGSPGAVCSLAVGPGVQVSAWLVERTGDDLPVRLVAPALGLDERTGPGEGSDWSRPVPGDHPLLEHAVAFALEPWGSPDGIGLDVEITSAVPPGASLGTSASVVVALLAALDELLGGDLIVRHADLAQAAHEVETARAGREAGVQDQWAAAFGGASLLSVGPYPDVRRRAVQLDQPIVDQLDARLVTVVFGAHDSSAVHHEVINALTGCGGPEHDRARGALRRLAALAGEAASALAAGDLARWADVLLAATDAQGQLHPALVGPAHRAAIDIGRSLGAVGWKVNGAGGDGGSLTLLAGDGDAGGGAAELAATLRAHDPTWVVPTLRVSRGPVGWEALVR